MRTLVVTEFITLDGIVDSPGGGDHPHAGWTFTDVEHDDAVYEIKGRETTQASALLLGRQSYDEFAPVWPSMDEFETYNAMPKYVVSTTLPGDTAPWGEGEVFHHIGLYTYRRAALDRFVALPPSPLELRERLEQLRALENGMSIGVRVVDAVPFGVDTPADLERARRILGHGQV